MSPSYSNLLILILNQFICTFAWSTWEAPQSETYCLSPNVASVSGGSQGRLVPEGGRIVLTCCLPGNTTGHDHEQLIWTDPLGKSIINYFSHAAQAGNGQAYTVPDFSEKNKLVSGLTI